MTTGRSGFFALACLTAITAVAAPTLAATRDHRGKGGAAQGGVTVNGKPTKVTTPPKLGGPKHKGGFKGLTSGYNRDIGPHSGQPGGAVVRDHRKQKPPPTR